MNLVENRSIVGFVVVAAVAGVDLRLEDCRLLVLLEALAVVMGMAKEVNHIPEARQQQQMLLNIVPLGGKAIIRLSPSIFSFFSCFRLVHFFILSSFDISVQLKLTVIPFFFINVPLQIVCNSITSIPPQ